jgi:hypothetical protein
LYRYNGPPRASRAVPWARLVLSSSRCHCQGSARWCANRAARVRLVTQRLGVALAPGSVGMAEGASGGNVGMPTGGNVGMPPPSEGNPSLMPSPRLRLSPAAEATVIAAALQQVARTAAAISRRIETIGEAGGAGACRDDSRPIPDRPRTAVTERRRRRQRRLRLRLTRGSRPRARRRRLSE